MYIDWQIVQEGPCIQKATAPVKPLKHCPQFCTLDFTPICASFNQELRQFSNRCQLQRTICELNEGKFFYGSILKATGLKLPIAHKYEKDNNRHTIIFYL